MPFDPAVDFKQAESARVQKLSIAKARRVPDPLGVIEEASKRHTYHIFNVGPWPQKIGLGSLGFFYVPGCPKDKDYVEAPNTVGGIVSELTIKDEYEYNRLMSDGWQIAQEIVGIGRHRNPKQALTHYGLFASKNATPTAAETSQAKLMLHATCSEIVAEARNLFAQDRKTFSVVVRPNRHYVAAAVLNLEDEDWMTTQTPSSRIKCQYCGSMNDAIAVLCQKCNHIINAERYRELRAQEEAIMGSEDRPRKSRPDVAERNRKRAQDTPEEA